MQRHQYVGENADIGEAASINWRINSEMNSRLLKSLGRLTDAE